MYNLTNPSVTFDSTTSGSYTEGTNITIGTLGQSAADAAEALAHELGHAFQNEYGYNQATVGTQSRQAYITTELTNEAVAENLAQTVYSQLANQGQMTAPNNASQWQNTPANQKLCQGTGEGYQLGTGSK